MIDYISEKLTDYLYSINAPNSTDWFETELKVRLFVFNILTTSMIFIPSILLGIFVEMLIVSIVFNILRLSVGGLHFSLNNCSKLTIPLILLVSYLSKLFQSFYWLTFLLAIAGGFYLIRLVPQDEDGKLELDLEKRELARNQYVNWFLFIYILACLSYLFNWQTGASAFSFGIFTVLFTLSKLGSSLLIKINNWLDKIERKT